MIIDITGTELIPGNQGRDCPGNGLHPGIECCCDECDYMMCCYGDYKIWDCKDCDDTKCPRARVAHQGLPQGEGRGTALIRPR